MKPKARRWLKAILFMLAGGLLMAIGLILLGLGKLGPYVLEEGRRILAEVEKKN